MESPFLRGPLPKGGYPGSCVDLPAFVSGNIPGVSNGLPLLQHDCRGCITLLCWWDRSTADGPISEDDYGSCVDGRFGEKREIAPVMNEQGAIECGCVPGMMR